MGYPRHTFVRTYFKQFHTFFSQSQPYVITFVLPSVITKMPQMNTFFNFLKFLWENNVHHFVHCYVIDTIPHFNILLNFFDSLIGITLITSAGFSKL